MMFWRSFASCLLFSFVVSCVSADSFKEEFSTNAGDSLYLKDGWKLPDFHLVNQDGEKFTQQDLRGKFTVVNLFYTSCPLCPSKHMPQMRELYDTLANFPGTVQLVSVSVNPDQDSADILKEFAKSFSAETTRWQFLSGEKEPLYDFVEKGLKLPRPIVTKAQEGDIPDILHAFRFVIVGPDGRVSGLVDGTDPESVPRVRQRLKQLIQADKLETGYYFPTINAALNGLSGCFIVFGYVAIRRRWLITHKWAMLGALAISAIFLACYLYYHLVIRGGESTKFMGEGATRYTYFAILLSHTLLAMLIAPMALYTAYLGLRDKLAGHVRLARWTLPLWLYVSVTGVLVYWMLYHL